MKVTVIDIGLGNGLVLILCWAITWTYDDLLLIGPLGTNFSEIWIALIFIKKKFKNVLWRLSAIFGSALVLLMACRLFSTKLLSKPMLDYCQLDPWEQT